MSKNFKPITFKFYSRNGKIYDWALLKICNYLTENYVNLNFNKKRNNAFTQLNAVEYVFFVSILQNPLFAFNYP